MLVDESNLPNSFYQGGVRRDNVCVLKVGHRDFAALFTTSELSASM